MQTTFELPEPAPEALAHSARLAGLIHRRIAHAGGWIDFADFMELALYAPGLGYYSSGTAKFGVAGDFVTAPEISPLFARCLARAIAPVLHGLPEATLLELGAGSGALAAELIPALLRLGVPLRRYLILEVSADLRARQRSLLLPASAPGWPELAWLDTLPAQPLEGVVIANEVADALPVSRFMIHGGAVQALGVGTADGGAFAWAGRPAEPSLAQAVAGLLPDGLAGFAEGYASELCRRLPAWIASLSAVLGRGALVLCDYGMARHEYYHPQRLQGTLSCHYRHRMHDDPFRYPGLQDITAWVDFTAVAEAAQASGLEVGGYATQGHFLLDAGLEAELAGAEGRPALQLAQQARTLLLPGEMGERFKLMALLREAAMPRGFGFRDLRHAL
ncbi:MAG: SAM-dependent methyltransferase [Gammaproteobacteria bacterium]|nr:SAM-dependent methyltransferase [Gammaproteobacteria bacterium]